MMNPIQLDWAIISSLQCGKYWFVVLFCLWTNREYQEINTTYSENQFQCQTHTVYHWMYDCKKDTAKVRVGMIPMPNPKAIILTRIGRWSQQRCNMSVNRSLALCTFLCNRELGSNWTKTIICDPTKSNCKHLLLSEEFINNFQINGHQIKVAQKENKITS